MAPIFRSMGYHRTSAKFLIFLISTNLTLRMTFRFPVFDYVPDFSPGRSFFHFGLSFTLLVSSSHWIMPWSDKRREYSMSFWTGTPS